MPALLRSLKRTSLKVPSSGALAGSADEVLKSGTAILTFSTPNPVPVRIQSCWAERLNANRKSAGANAFLRIIDLVLTMRFSLPLKIKPKFYAHAASRIVVRQRSEGINALQRARGRLVKRRHAAALADLHILGLAVAADLKGHVNPLC